MVVKDIPEQNQAQTFGLDKMYMWMKGLECKVNNLLREVNILKSDFIKKNQEMKKEIKLINDDVLEMKHEQEKTLQKMDIIIKELKKTAGVEDIMTLRKYVEFWNPLNFVTQRDLERMVESKLHSPAKNTSNKK